MVAILHDEFSDGEDEVLEGLEVIDGLGVEDRMEGFDRAVTLHKMVDDVEKLLVDGDAGDGGA